MEKEEKISNPKWAEELVTRGLSPYKVAYALANRQITLLARIHRTRPQNVRDLIKRWGFERDEQLIKEYSVLLEKK